MYNFFSYFIHCPNNKLVKHSNFDFIVAPAKKLKLKQEKFEASQTFPGSM